MSLIGVDVGWPSIFVEGGEAVEEAVVEASAVDVVEEGLVVDEGG